VLVRSENKLLLIKRGQEPAKGEWSMPGGLVELGETLADAIHREIFEECAIRIRLQDQLESFEFIEKDDHNLVKFHYIVLDFWATYVDGRLTAASDVDDAQWFTKEQIQKLGCSDKIKELAFQVFEKSEKE
jgi:ADP-ribose pyrophosphatase